MCRQLWREVVWYKVGTSQAPCQLIRLRNDRDVRVESSGFTNIAARDDRSRSAGRVAASSLSNYDGWPHLINEPKQTLFLHR